MFVRNEVAGRWVPLCLADMYFMLAGLVVLRIGIGLRSCY